MIPPKLKPGDEVRIIAPARSLSIISEDLRQNAKKRFQELGLKLTFGKHIEESDDFKSSSIDSRIEDLHDAFRDKNVKAIFTVIGGFNSNQLLRYIDYKLIKKNPKILCGYSDITALHNAIYAKTGLVTYLGPAFSTLGMKKGLEYTLQQLRSAILQPKPYVLESSKQWSDDEWYREQEKRTFIQNKGYVIINEGKAKGTAIGGNICTLQLLHGTEYMPSLKGTILLIEEDDFESIPIIERDIQSIVHQQGFEGVKGVLVGRFQKKTGMTPEILRKILDKEGLRELPIIANVDFGHTTPHATLPIGGTISMSAYKGKAEIRIEKH